MAALLQEGAGGLDASAFAVAGEELAAHLSFWASDDAVGLGATMLADERQETVELLRLALTEPRFDPEAVERLRAQVLASIHAAAADPGSVGAHAFYADAFPGHPYGRPTNGTVESVAAIGVDDLRRAHAAALTRDRLHVAVVGAIRPDEVGPLLDRLFGDLPEAGRALPPPVEPSLSGDTSVIDFDTPQSLVVFGNAGLRSDDPDLIPALVMDYILGGGGFGSRLTSEMREKRGLTYGVYTYLAAHTLAGLYMGSFSSSNDRVAAALAILRAEWDRMAERRRDRRRARQRQALPHRRLRAALRRQRQHRRRAARGAARRPRPRPHQRPQRPRRGGHRRRHRPRRPPPAVVRRAHRRGRRPPGGHRARQVTGRMRVRDSDAGGPCDSVVWRGSAPPRPSGCRTPAPAPVALTISGRRDL